MERVDITIIGAGVISEESDKNLPNFINLIGIESPGLTACLAIAKEVKKNVSSST